MATQIPVRFMTSIQFAVGAPLAGSWLSSILFGVELFCYVLYVRKFGTKDQVFVQACVLLSLLLSVANIVNQYAYCFHSAVIAWGNPIALLAQGTAYCVFMITTGSLGLVGQVFLVRRVYLLSKSLLYAVVLMVPVLTAWVCAIIAAALVRETSKGSLGITPKINRTLIIWLATSAGADILIAAGLLFLLARFKTNFDHTQTLVRRMSLKTIETGSATSILALISLFVFVFKPQTNVELGLAFVLARVYSLTLMYNVLARTGTNTPDNTSRSRTATELGTFRKFNHTGGDPIDLSRVQVTIATQNDVSDEKRDEASSTKSEEARAGARSWA